jgi:hypothetical protein
LPLFPSCQQSLRYGSESLKPLAEVQPFMTEDIVASHPLLMTTAVLSGECVEKLEILSKHLKTYQNNLSILYIILLSQGYNGDREGCFLARGFQFLVAITRDFFKKILMPFFHFSLFFISFIMKYFSKLFIKIDH